MRKHERHVNNGLEGTGVRDRSDPNGWISVLQVRPASDLISQDGCVLHRAS